MKRGIYLFPSLITLCNLAAGVMAIIFASQDHLTSAAWCIIAGIVMDIVAVIVIVLVVMLLGPVAG